MAKKTGAILPALQTKVLPAPHLLYIWDAFGKLSTERTFALGPGPIPVISGIERYGREMGIAHLERFVQLVRQMDNAWLHHTNEKTNPSA